MHGKTKQLVFHITMLCFTNPNTCRNITPTPLQSLLFNNLNTTTQCRVGFHMRHLFYFCYFHFLSTSLLTSRFPNILLPHVFSSSLTYSILCGLKKLEYNIMWQMSWHISWYKQCAFFTLIFTVASRTYNKLAPLLLPHKGSNHNRKPA